VSLDNAFELFRDGRLGVPDCELRCLLWEGEDILAFGLDFFRFCNLHVVGSLEVATLTRLSPGRVN
jgi:hypothetical protein